MEITRAIIENHVGGVNKHLQNKVKGMSMRELLNNAHPDFRQDCLKDKHILKSYYGE